MLAALRRARALHACCTLAEPIPALCRQFAQTAAVEVQPPGGDAAADGTNEAPKSMCQTTADILLDTDSETGTTVAAVLRHGSGSTAAERMRRAGQTPAILFSLPGNKSQLLAVDSREITRLIKQHGRQSFLCQVLNVTVEGDQQQSYRVVPRLLHMNAATDAVENVTFMHMPMERRAVFDVPITVTGEDVSPGIKRGGWVNVVQRTVSVSCPGDAVLPSIEIDVSGMDLSDKLTLGALAARLPAGTHTLLAKDMRHPVVRIGGRGNR